MLLSIQLLSVQLSSMYSCFQFCGLWHFVECCSQYTIQRCAPLNTAFRCISSKMSFRSLESVIQKSHVKLSVGLGPYTRAFIHTWASLGASGGSSEVCQPGLHRNPNIHTYICAHLHNSNYCKKTSFGFRTYKPDQNPKTTIHVRLRLRICSILFTNKEYYCTLNK